jgi:hypothetical protein
VATACSLSIPGYSFGQDAPYPEIAHDYEASIAKLRRVRCDVLPFIDPVGCRRYLDSAADAELRRAPGGLQWQLPASPRRTSSPHALMGGCSSRRPRRRRSKM